MENLIERHRRLKNHLIVMIDDKSGTANRILRGARVQYCVYLPCTAWESHKGRPIFTVLVDFVYDNINRTATPGEVELIHGLWTSNEVRASLEGDYSLVTTCVDLARRDLLRRAKRIREEGNRGRVIYIDAPLPSRKKPRSGGPPEMMPHPDRQPRREKRHKGQKPQHTKGQQRPNQPEQQHSGNKKRRKRKRKRHNNGGSQGKGEDLFDALF